MKKLLVLLLLFSATYSNEKVDSTGLESDKDANVIKKSFDELDALDRKQSSQKSTNSTEIDSLAKISKENEILQRKIEILKEQKKLKEELKLLEQQNSAIDSSLETTSMIIDSTESDSVTEISHENRAKEKTFHEIGKDAMELIQKRISNALAREEHGSVKKVSKPEEEEKEDDVEEVSSDALVKFQEKVNKIHNYGYGGAGGFTMGATYANLSYVNTLLANENKISSSPIYGKNLQLPLSNGKYATMYSVGGFGFAGMGNGVRIGGAGYGISQLFDLYHKDTLYRTMVSIGYGGLIIEKGFVSGRNTFVFGTLLGAGGVDLTISKDGYAQKNSSSFSNGSSSSSDDNSFGLDANNTAGAFFASELYLRYTHSVLPWFHIGIKGGTSYFNSIDVENPFGEYSVFNPTFGVNFIFGNLG